MRPRRTLLCHPHEVDLVAIVSVIASATVGLSAAGVSLYGIHRTARTARATQLRQRKADAYLEVLRLMEAQAQWITANATNLKANSDEEYYRYFAGQYDRQLPGPPALDSQAVMRAHVAAFGSTEARTTFKAWLFARKPIDDFFADLPFLVSESNNGAPPDEAQLKPLLDALPVEERARAAFAEAAAKDLEHE